MHLDFEYYLFYKPFQVLCQFSPSENKKTLVDFFPGIKKDIYPVGRLDYDSEGLLLLTNDKELNHKLLHPKFVHERCYWAQVEGYIDDAALQQLRKGVSITVEGKVYNTQRATAVMLAEPELPPRNPPIRYRAQIPTSWIALTLTEGKNRQVRKMTASVGFPTLRLVRYSIGSLTIAELEPGAYHKLSAQACKQLFDRS
jgi:23S rRNA pseudouridine2457 synthase